MKKSHIFLTAILLMFVIPTYALAAGSTDADRIYTDNSKVVVGSSIQIKYKISGEVTSEKYSSNNTLIATVNNKGLITGISPGEVTIKAEVTSRVNASGCDHNNNLASELKIKVTSKGDYVINDITIFEGKEANIEVTFPEGYTGSSKGIWTLEDSSIATIDADGLVKALRVGSTTASYMVEEDTGTAFQITVEELFKLSITQNQIYKGISQAVDLKYNDKYDGKHIGTWESNVPEKVSVDENGILSILKADIDSASSIRITYTDSETFVSHSVWVLAWKLFKQWPEVLSMKEKESGAFRITFAPIYDGGKSGTWSIGDDSLATIDSNTGQVYGIMEGITTVTFEHIASGLREEVTLKVLPADEPTRTPSPTPTLVPIPSPISVPSPATTVPTDIPESTPIPSPELSPIPSPELSPMATPEPTPIPTPEPTPMPTTEPTPMETPEPTPMATPEPTPMPTPEPTLMPIPELSPMPA